VLVDPGYENWNRKFFKERGEGQRKLCPSMKRVMVIGDGGSEKK
jgi:hypothetical protein